MNALIGCSVWNVCSENFEAALTALHDSNRLRMLDACTNEDHGLKVDFQSTKDELKDLLDFLSPPGGSLRGSAALSLLRDVFQTLDKEKKGKVPIQTFKIVLLLN
jgi:hypothetical protein